MNILHSYVNGNTRVSIYDDGSKVREYDETIPVVLDHFESVDCKITNYCDANCQYCHEKSDVSGNHADLNVLIKKFSVLPPGVEIAIGGGNPLSHPDLIPFLIELRNMGLIANMTVNQKHLKQYKNSILMLIQEKLINGVGISYSNKNMEDITPILNATNNVVFHMIMGINSITDVDYLYDYCSSMNKACKILVLGYKEYGKGLDYLLKNKMIESNKYKWYTQLATRFKKNNLVLSFDNLAIDQLNLRRFFTDDAWKMFYMGNDGKYTLFIDAVNRQYAKSSTSSNRTDFDSMELITFFKKISDNS